MPTLQLFPDEVSPVPNRSALRYVAALMLWPNAEVKRREAEKAALADEATRWLGTIDKDAAIDAGSVAQFARWAITVPRLMDVQAGAENQFRDGAMAGTILHDFLGWRALGHPAPVDLIKGQVAHRFRMSKQHVENRAWKHFRCVAHLWSAWITFAAEYRSEGESGGLPCRFADFPAFLALSERNRIEGESAEFLQSAKGTVLKPGETWRVPSELRLPEISVEIVKKLPNLH
jgi:hypothetical protein